MTQRDEAMGALGGHDPGKPGGTQHVTFHCIAFKNEIERFLPHQDAPLRDGDTLGCPFFGDIDHTGFASLVDMGEDAWGRGRRFGGRPGTGRTWLATTSRGLFPAARDGFTARRHRPHSAAARRGSDASKARVAAATSPCRMRLSPIRNVETPTRFRRARSAGVLSPLSATTTRSLGIPGASRSLTASDVSNVRKLRL